MAAVTKTEALARINALPDDEHWQLVRLSRRHKRVTGEPKRYVRLEALESQQVAFYEVWEPIVAAFGRTLAFDVLIRALADLNAQGVEDE
jgi:hypothetical protein